MATFIFLWGMGQYVFFLFFYFIFLWETKKMGQYVWVKHAHFITLEGVELHAMSLGECMRVTAWNSLVGPTGIRVHFELVESTHMALSLVYTVLEITQIDLEV